MDIRPLTPTEQKYTYAQSMQLEGQTGTIGHLRGDFATTGYGFYTTWFDTRPQWKSDEFKADLDTVINALREDKGLLHNRYDMRLEGIFPKVLLRATIVRSTVSVWIRRNTLFCFDAIPPKATIIFTAIVM